MTVLSTGHATVTGGRDAGSKVCPYSNATRGNIDVTLTANGRPVDA